VSKTATPGVVAERLGATLLVAGHDGGQLEAGHRGDEGSVEESAGEAVAQRTAARTEAMPDSLRALNLEGDAVVGR
jgi:hypothetical protein